LISILGLISIKTDIKVLIEAKPISHMQIFTIIYSPNGRLGFFVRYYKTIRSRIIPIQFKIKPIKLSYYSIFILSTIKIKRIFDINY